MKERSNLLLFALAFDLVSRNATQAFLSRSRSEGLPTRTNLNKPTQLHMDLGFLSSALPALQESFLFPPAAELSTLGMIQTVGETSFAGMLGIAGIQGALVMKQYQNNPCGGLIVPPGLTQGNEDATQDSIGSPSFDFMDSAKNKQSTLAPLQQSSSLSDADLEDMVCDATDNTVICALKKRWYHAATKVMAIALVPLAAIAAPSWGLAAWVIRYGHLVHLAVIFGLTHVYDFFRKLPTMDSCEESLHPDTASCSLGDEDPIFEGDNPRVLVLGDSMCVGIGSCEVFDAEKVYDIPLHKEEHLAASEEELASSKNMPGPMFPRVLAKTLSQRFQKPVAWRSAGVDGGATQDIAEHLMSVVQDEVDQRLPPDLVVVLTGSNDLKDILNGAASVKGFRSNLMKLTKDIRAISPKTKVVFPALPTYRMDTKSVLNIFPLSVCLDSIMGLWDAQKMAVTDQCPGVMHVDLTVADVNSWYQPEDGIQDGEPISLIAADGIHPNARCYSKWGAFVGNNLADQILNGHAQEPQILTNKHSLNRGYHRPAFSGGFHATTPAFGAAVRQQKQDQ